VISVISVGVDMDGSRHARLRQEERFAAELSHELRTPLAKISAESELALRRTRSVDEYVAALEVVKRSAEQMTRTVNTLIAAARSEPRLVGTSADAGDAAVATIANCWPLAAEQGIAIEIDVPPSPVLVGVDGNLVERILQPLLENACRYARSRIRVSLARGEYGVLLSLQDDGPGVAAEERDWIFEPGGRGSAATPDSDVSGAGLGLSLSRRLARAVGGEVSLGAPATGALFLVRLPAPG
jgi:signal transduction histidine kinase